jgi:hypothetical protein
VSQTHFHATTSTSGLPDNNPAGETLSQAAAAVSNVGIAVGNTTLPGFPLGVTSGSYDRILSLNDPTIYNVTFLGNNGNSATTAGSTFVAALAAGKTYWNIHSSAFPGGEIRAFPVPVPEPAAALLVGMSVAGLGMARRRNA